MMKMVIATLQTLKILVLTIILNGDADEVPTGKCLILVTADAKRTMSTALNVSALMRMDDIDFVAMLDTDILYVEGYMVTSDENYSVTLELLKERPKKYKNCPITFRSRHCYGI